MIYLDFDGVLADSAQECFFVTKNLFPKENSEQIREKFLKYRYFVKEPYGFLILWNLIESDVADASLEDTYYHNYLNKSKSEINLMTNSFFLKRREIISEYGSDYWCKLNPQTSFCKKFIEFNKLKNLDFCILSTKDENSLALWLNYFKLKPVKIFGNESYSRYRSKFNLIKEMSPKEPNIFIDDNLEHIDSYDWQSIYCKAYYAEWGYNRALKNNEDFILSKIFN